MGLDRRGVVVRQFVREKEKLPAGSIRFEIILYSTMLGKRIRGRKVQKDLLKTKNQGLFKPPRLDGEHFWRASTHGLPSRPFEADISYRITHRTILHQIAPSSIYLLND
jgi:hypothetical protein